MRITRSAIVSAAALSFAGMVGCESDPSPDPVPITSHVELRDDMRELWTAHVTWTRMYLIGVIAGNPDTTQAAERLLENQADIGNAIRRFYGEAAGDELTALLREHITGATDVVVAAQSGSAAALDVAVSAWFVNADAIAAFLAAANPYLAYEELGEMMRAHLEQTIAEATARLEGDWERDIAAYDAIVAHILVMADVLAQGIEWQFPELVASPNISARDEALHVGMRALWQDHATWTRVFLVGALAAGPDTQPASERLLRNQSDIGDAIRPFYGDAAADQLTTLLEDHILGAAAVVAAAAAGDGSALAIAQEAWYANADEIAAFLADANPSWHFADLQGMMRHHLDQTTTEATARITHEWKADVEAYDAVVLHVLGMSDALSAGLATQFPDHAGGATAGLGGHSGD